MLNSRPRLAQYWVVESGNLFRYPEKIARSIQLPQQRALVAATGFFPPPPHKKTFGAPRLGKHHRQCPILSEVDAVTCVT
jgi:hypothetical protein